MTGRAVYYQQLKYCVENKKFPGLPADYEEMDKKMKTGCDVKLNFSRRVPIVDPDTGKEYRWGHVETVTSVDTKKRAAKVNSWGNEGKVTGGDAGNFKHSRDGRGNQFALEDKSRWPLNATDVFVEYVCPCKTMTDEAKKINSAKNK